MSGVLRFDQLDSSRQAAIRANLDVMKAKGASDSDIETYLTQHEHLAPVSGGPDFHDVTGGASSPAEPIQQSFENYAAGSIPFVNKAGAAIETAVHQPRNALRLLGQVAAGNPKAFANAPQPLVDEYNQRYEANQAGRRQYQSENPKEAFGAAVTGNLIPAIATLGGSAEAEIPSAAEAAASAAKGLGSKMLKGIPVGAGYGALQGASEGHGSPQDYARQIGVNTALGATLGAAAPILTSAGGAVLRKLGVGDALSAGAEKMGLPKLAALIGTKGKAADVLAQRSESDAASGFVPKDIPEGVPMFPLDKTGPDVQGLAEGIASRPGPGRSKIVGKITARQEQMRPAITQALTEGTGVRPGAGISATANELNMLKLKGDQAFKAARKETAGQPIVSPTLNDVTNTDIGKDAFNWAMNRRGELPGELPTTSTPTEALTKLTAMGAPEGKAAAALGDQAYDVKTLPDPETLHLMKRFLYQVANGKMPGATTKQAAEAAGALNQWGKIRDELPESWRTADDIYAQQAKIVDASNVGRQIFKTKINPITTNPRKAVAQSLGKLQQRVAESTPEEQAATQQGAGSAAHALWESTPNTQNFPGKVFAKSGERTQQTAMAFPDEASANAFQKQVSAWDDIQAQANKILKGSPTAGRQAENTAASSLPDPIQAVRHPLRALGTVMKGDVAAQQRLAQQKLDDKIADFLTGPDISSIPNALLVARLRRAIGAKTPYLAPIALSGGATGNRNPSPE